MTKQITFKGASEMPEISISRGNMEWNKTGAWRTQRPFYEDKTPPCSAACPAGNDIVGFIQKISQEDFEGAWNILHNENPFPGVCGRVCFHPCETKCNRGSYDEPIAIHALERFVADYGARQSKKIEKPSPPQKGRIAIVGSGPAGMSCAYHLARLGYQVTVFESLPLAGGLLRMGIPSYRLPKDVLDREISAVEALGVDIRTGVPFGEEIRLEDLKDFQATFVATGAHLSRRLNISGEKGKGVFNGLDLLKKINLQKKTKLGDRVVVVGGGNTAIDVARSVIRLGKKATILYRRAKEEMPAFGEEVSEALEEGVKIRYLVTPIRIEQKDGLKRLECVKMALGEKDESGRRKPIPLPNRRVIIEADSVVVAAGEEIDLSYLPQGIGKKEGIVLTQSDGRTTVERVFAGGDLASNQRTVAHAIGSGKKAAVAIDAYLRGLDSEEALRSILIGNGPSISVLRYLQTEERTRNSHVVTLDELNLDYFEHARREETSRIPPRERIKGFMEVTAPLTEEAALAEARRCFSCGTCNECENCYVFCPDAAILRMEDAISHQVDYDFCKGCGICFTECPRCAISLREEAR